MHENDHKPTEEPPASELEAGDEDEDFLALKGTEHEAGIESSVGSTGTPESDENPQ